MPDRPKRVAAIHDLSGYGRCSLSVALPVLSGMGHEVCALPTAVLSSHTGGLPGVTVRDLTPEMGGFLRQWQALGLQFDAIYTGFLGSGEQIGLVEDFLHTFRRPETLILVDPAMADQGMLDQDIAARVMAPRPTASLATATAIMNSASPGLAPTPVTRRHP